MTLTEPVRYWIYTKPVRDTAKFWLGGIKDTDEFLLSYTTRFLVSSDSDTAEFWLTTKTYLIPKLSYTEPMRYWTYHILNLPDSKPIRYQTCQIPTYQILNPKDTKPVRYWTYQILSLSNTKSVRYQTCQIPNLSDTKPVRYRTYQILNPKDTKPVRYWTYQILSLSYTKSVRYQTFLILSSYQILSSLPLPIYILRWPPPLLAPLRKLLVKDPSSPLPLPARGDLHCLLNYLCTIYEIA